MCVEHSEAIVLHNAQFGLKIFFFRNKMKFGSTSWPVKNKYIRNYKRSQSLSEGSDSRNTVMRIPWEKWPNTLSTGGKNDQTPYLQAGKMTNALSTGGKNDQTPYLQAGTVTKRPIYRREKWPNALSTGGKKWPTRYLQAGKMTNALSTGGNCDQTRYLQAGNDQSPYLQRRESILPSAPADMNIIFWSNISIDSSLIVSTKYHLGFLKLSLKRGVL